MKLTIRHIIIPLLLLIHFAAPANTVKGRIKGIALSNGLSDLLVNVIYKDSKGYIWFGTEQAADRFDGNDIVSFQIEGNNRHSKRVKAIAENRKGSLYIGTTQGIYLLAPGKTVLEQIAPSTINFSVNAISSDGVNSLYLATQQGLYIYNERNGNLSHKLPVNDNMSDENEIFDLFAESDGGVWMISSHNLWHKPYSSNTISPYPLNIRTSTTHFARSGNTIYIGTIGDGIIPFNIKTKRFDNPIIFNNSPITSLSVTKDGILTIGTDGEGIYLFNTETDKIFDHISTTDGLRSNAV